MSTNHHIFFVYESVFSYLQQPKSVSSYLKQLPVITRQPSFLLFTNILIFYLKIIKYNRTTIPKTIRYQPKTLKSCFLIYPIRNLITITETTNAVIIPVKRIINSFPLKEKPNFTIFSRLAPNITGIAKKKVNSAATVLETPIRRAPKMVAPEREVPGKIAAISWNKPIISAVW